MQIKDSIVAHEARMTSIINNFGEVAPMVEHNVFSWMKFLSEDYDGGMLDYHELSNGGFYCPTQGGVKPPPLGGGFSVSFVVCGHEQLS